MPTDLRCPCDLALPLADCCSRWFDGPLRLQAPDAAALMRSRYAAFALQRADYLLATWHPSTRPDDFRLEPGLRWLGLQLRRHLRIDETHAVVEFIARSKLGGRAHRMHETSRFRREGGHWYYVDGEIAA